MKAFTKEPYMLSSEQRRIAWGVPLLLLALSACSGNTGGASSSAPAGGDDAETTSALQGGGVAGMEEGSAGGDPSAETPDGQEAGGPVGDGGASDGGASDSGSEGGEAGGVLSPPEQPAQDDAQPTQGDAGEGDAGAPGAAPPVQGDDATSGAEGEEDSAAEPATEPMPMVLETRSLGGRGYLVYRPSPVRRGVPVVLLLHAATENMHSVFDDRRPSAAWMALAREGQFILVAPNGSAADGESDDDANYWNDCADNSRQSRLNSRADDLAFLSDLIERVVAEHAADAQRVYAYGLSNGGSMALRLAQEVPERLAGVVSVLGLAAEEGECVSPATATPVMLMHGTEDPLASYSDGSGILRDYLLGAEESYQQWLTFNGAGSEPEKRFAFADRSLDDDSTVTCKHRGAAHRRVQLCTMEGAGHLDPSVRYPYGSGASSFGTQNRDIESAVVAWAFLRDVTVGNAVAME